MFSKAPPTKVATPCIALLVAAKYSEFSKSLFAASKSTLARSAVSAICSINISLFSGLTIAK